MKAFRDTTSGPSSRAKSARDLFIIDHPEIREQVVHAAHAEGVTDHNEITRRINNAHSEVYKIVPDEERLKYQRLSEEDRLHKAAERENVREAIAQEDPPVTSQKDRAVYVLHPYVVSCKFDELSALYGTFILRYRESFPTTLLRLIQI